MQPFLEMQEEENSSQVVISTATATDAINIFRVINMAYSVESGDTGISFKKTNRLLDPFDSGLDAAYENGSVIKAEWNGEIIGVIVWELVEIVVDEKSCTALYFGPFAVLPSHQKRKVGKRLLDEIDRIAIERGINYIEISVVNHRTDLFPIYERLGYTYCGTGEFPDPERITRPCNFVKMRRSLSNSK